ncbi:MAG TPA: hypothetical protein VNT75_17995 [Symbiobacteriaceae bacterium]|nr:hypothetical protein [Symbiobacteriaceae bacterium]
MDFRLDARLSSGLAYLVTTAALILSVFWYSSERPALIYAGTGAFLVLLGAVYFVRSRFVVVHALHSLLLLLVQYLWWRYIPVVFDLLLVLGFLTFFAMKNALQGYTLDWFLLNWLRRWLMPHNVTE